MEKIAVITARGGSRRIPHKNIKDFCGMPILLYSIQAACKSGMFQTVMVSTDDRQIAQTALAAGAEVPFLRSQKNADDYASTSDVLLEVFQMYAQRGKQFGQACCIYPTAPFLTAETLRYGMECLRQTKADTVLPVVKYSYPPQRAMWVRDGKLCPVCERMLQSRSQDLEPVYHDAGQFYCFDVEKFLASGDLLSGFLVPVILDEMQVQDIDNLSDWELAEMKYQLLCTRPRKETCRFAAAAGADSRTEKGKLFRS